MRYFCLVVLFSLTACNSSQKNKEVIENYQLPVDKLEEHRPVYHFTPDSMWMNDPNGMVYYEGEYHLFYQHYPEKTVWGPMHWGHAISRDLVNWTHQPIALFPDEHGLIFSGSAVVDWQNTSGFGSKEHPPLVAIYTYHNMKREQLGENDFQTQGIAFSKDKGRTWEKYELNPVLDNPGIRDFRDPKVIWHEATNQWIMVLAGGDRIHFYHSSNLKEWEKSSEFGLGWGNQGRPWECPDLFPLKIEDSEEEKWVLIVSIGSGASNGGSGTQYFIGNFDGKTFTLDPEFEKYLGHVQEIVPDGIVFADFEQDNYSNWVVEGEAFGRKPANGTLENQNLVTRFTGNQLVNTFKGGDSSIGKLSSPEFIINNDYINFQIAGGIHIGKTCMNLRIDDQVVYSQTGDNSETLKWRSWDVSNFKGKKALLEIVDNHTGGYGHICLDQIIFSDQPAVGAYDKAFWVDWGKDNYAGVTWSDVPTNDGRRIFIGWMSNWQYATVVPTDKWRSAMTIPRALSLKQTVNGPRLFSRPINELKQLRGNGHEIDQASFLVSAAVELELEFSGSFEEIAGLELSNDLGETLQIGYRKSDNQYFINRTNSGKNSFSDVFSGIHTASREREDSDIGIQVFIDRASVEVFGDDGQTVMTEIFFPNNDFSKITIIAPESLKKGFIYNLKNELSTL